jgi:hypothetical protein
VIGARTNGGEEKVIQGKEVRDLGRWHRKGAVFERRTELLGKGAFEGGDDFPDGAVPEGGDGEIDPVGGGREEDGLVPEEALVLTAGGFRLGRLGGSQTSELGGNEMMGVPELAGARVGDAGEGAAAGGAPVGGENGFPDDQDTQVRIGVTMEKLGDRGGPPQTGWSCGREQQEQARGVGGAVEGGFEFVEVCRCES